MQFFKGDDTEQKIYLIGSPIMDALSAQKDAFLAGAFTAGPLGELIYQDSRSPLANAIDEDVFTESFPIVFDAFIAGGSFESYLTVFRNVFGDDVVVTFTVPAAGRLQIDIAATGVELSDMLARTISGVSYTYDEVVDRVLDNIAFRTVKGFITQYELEQMLFEMVPAGIFTEITLNVGA